jgi:hypothetical protein
LKARLTQKSIFLIARIWALLSLAFLIFFISAHIFGKDESGAGFRSVHEVINFICFPVCVLLGLIVAMKYPGPGGLITVAGLVGFGISAQQWPDLFIFLLAAPGILFLSRWFLINRS